MIEQRLQQLSKVYTLVLVPGLRDSDEHHWQSCWGRRFPFWKRIQQKNWLEPDIENWVSAITRAGNVPAARHSRRPQLWRAGVLSAAANAAGKRSRGSDGRTGRACFFRT